MTLVQHNPLWSMSRYPKPVKELIKHFQQLPGVGRKTAERFAFHILTWKSDEAARFSESIRSVFDKLFECSTCGCYTEDARCVFCDKATRESRELMLVASPKDVYAIDDLAVFSGKFHVLGGLLSPLEGIFSQERSLTKLLQRIDEEGINEIILAFDTTLEGDATTLYLKEKLAEKNVAISRLASGLPFGSPLDYVDEQTLSHALSGRRSV